MRWGTRGLLVGCALALSACAVAVPLTITSTDYGAAARPGQIAIAAPDSGDQTLKARFAAALIDAFARQGLQSADTAPLLADYAVSVGSAEMGVRGPSAEPDDWITPPRKPRRFDKCKPKVLRGTLLLLNKTDGSVAYRGQGTATDCEFDDASLRVLADRLVADFLDQP